MPYNCYYRAKSSAYSRLWFNNNPANNRNPADAERDLLCERDVQAVIMRFNGECPPSRLIDNEDDCKQAAEKLRLPYTIGTNTDDLPRGCSISKDRHVFFNSHKIGRTSYERQPICYGYDRPGADQNKENMPHQNNPDNDYVLLENGQLNCPSGKEVVDADECKQAYRSLTSRHNFRNNNNAIQTQSWENLPSYCSVNRATGLLGSPADDSLHFNSNQNPGRVEKRQYRKICRTQAYVLLDNGKSCDADGLNAVSTPESCRRGSVLLKLSDNTVSTSSRKGMPFGCYFREKSNKQKLWFNANPENRKNGADNERKIICEKGYYTRVKSGQTCDTPNSMPISDIDGCRRAAEFLAATSCKADTATPVDWLQHAVAALRASLLSDHLGFTAS